MKNYILPTEKQEFCGICNTGVVDFYCDACSSMYEEFIHGWCEKCKLCIDGKRYFKHSVCWEAEEKRIEDFDNGVDWD